MTEKKVGWLRALGNRLTRSVLPILFALGISAEGLTWAGVWFAAFASLAIIGHQLFVAGLLLIIAGACDALDGSVARATKTDSASGAFLDSVLDRLSDCLPLIALMVSYPDSWLGRLSAGALIVSYLIPYAKARGESLRCQVDDGLMSRGPRMILLILGLLLGSVALAISLILMTFFGAITVIQRVSSCRQQLEN